LSFFAGFKIACYPVTKLPGEEWYWTEFR